MKLRKTAPTSISTSALYRKRILITSRWPFWLAAWRAVCPANTPFTSASVRLSDSSHFCASPLAAVFTSSSFTSPDTWVSNSFFSSALKRSETQVKNEGIKSAVKEVEFVSNSMSYNTDKLLVWYCSDYAFLNWGKKWAYKGQIAFVKET